MKKYLIVANWKMNPTSVKEATALAKGVHTMVRGSGRCEVVIAPPYPFIVPLRQAAPGLVLGAQDVSWADSGPYTGEVSWRQLKSLGVKYVIVGHSERKKILSESIESINKKVMALLSHGINAVLCVGESERHEGVSQEFRNILRRALKGAGKEQISKLVVAYEPVWAISTNPNSRPDTPANAFQVSLYLRRVITELFGANRSKGVRIIYGGSVGEKNIAGFLNAGQMDGALVGGASLRQEEFVNIVRRASELKIR